MGLRANFAGNLRKIRAAKGLSQEDVALEADVNRTYISDLEREVYSASLDLVEKIAAALNIDPLDLLQSPSPRSKERLTQRRLRR